MKPLSKKNKILYCGMFDSERFWKPRNLAALPTIADKSTFRIVNNMDELFFLFCRDDDILLTKQKFNYSFKQYLASIGYRFENINFSESSNYVDNIFQTSIIENNNPSLLNKVEISPFAVIPGISEMAQKYNLSYHAPSIEVVKKVNSKEYSKDIIDRLGLKNYGWIIWSIDDLIFKGEKLLRNGSILIKDVYGVSGKGSIHIKSSNTLKKIENHLNQQIKNFNKHICFILEPYFDKEKDFSCQLYIQSNGKIKILSIQILENENLMYKNSVSAESYFIHFLEKNEYFTVMIRACKILFKDGYYGDVCIDSMLLKNGEIIPIVEINARKSMSLLKYNLDMRLKNYGVYGSFNSVSFIASKKIAIQLLIDKLRERGILFIGNAGIMPLSANALITNYISEGTNYKGRLYYSLISSHRQDWTELEIKLKESLIELGVKKIM